MGYWGVSMGTSIGVPFLASEPRLDRKVVVKVLAPELGQRVNAQQASHPEAFLATTRAVMSVRLKVDDSRAIAEFVGRTETRLASLPRPLSATLTGTPASIR